MAVTDERRTELHKQVDADWQAVIKVMEKNSPPAAWIWTVRPFFDEWRMEKEYVDRYGRRPPKITNIEGPNGGY